MESDLLPHFSSLTYGAVAAAVVFWCDYLFMLPTEIQRMWRRPFTGSTVIYFILRYTLLVEQVFFLIGVLPSSYSDSACVAINYVGGVLLFLNNITIAVLIIVRGSAICSKKWKALVPLIPLALTPAVLSVLVTVALDADGARTSSFGYIGSSCLDIFTWSGIWRESSNILVFYIVLFLSLFPLATLIGITLYKTLQIRKSISTHGGARMPMGTLMICNGTIHFSLMVLNIILLIPSIPQNSPSYLLFTEAWTIFFPVLNVIILSHFMLALRPIYHSAQGSPDSEAAGALRKPAKAAGNLGATVSYERAAHKELLITDDPFRDGLQDAGLQETVAVKSVS